MKICTCIDIDIHIYIYVNTHSTHMGNMRVIYAYMGFGVCNKRLLGHLTHKLEKHMESQVSYQGIRGF